MVSLGLSATDFSGAPRPAHLRESVFELTKATLLVDALVDLYVDRKLPETAALNGCRKPGAVSRLAKMEHGRVQCGRLANDVSSQLNLEFMCHGEDSYADLFVLTISY